ncbi:MAG: hypothetical protein JWM56_1408 [Candidatus Peribacteria bacterium]|nr:hypothetical protein [Candidatus Peribacteria bacterium]
MDLLRYLFWPRPENAQYSDPKVIGLLVVCALFIGAALYIRVWRRKVRNPVTRKLSRSWASALFWFAFAAVLLILARTEGIQFLGMRILWLFWLLGIGLYAYFQYRQFKTRHYEVLPKEMIIDARDKYLPGKKKR